MGTIATGFKNYFKGFDLDLPDPIPAKGNVEESGWQVRYILNQDENNQPCLDFFAENRMTSPRHVRILNDGSIISLDSYQESYSHDPTIPGDEERAIREMQEHNDRVSETLKAKGF